MLSARSQVYMTCIGLPIHIGLKIIKHDAFLSNKDGHFQNKLVDEINFSENFRDKNQS